MAQEQAQVLLSLAVNILTQIGIPAVFVLAWYAERRSHARTTASYLRDLRRICKLSSTDGVTGETGEGRTAASAASKSRAFEERLRSP